MSPPVSLDSLSPRARAWNHCLVAAPGRLDLDLAADRIDGVIPEALRGGRMLVNGPGWNVIDGWILHPFDGHGYVRSFAFRRDGSCRAMARYVETPAYRAEAAEKRFLVRGFATNLQGPFWRSMDSKTPRNVANTTITRWKDRLLAGWEAGAPYALDARTLATLGEEHFGGALKGLATLAHIRHDAAQKRLITCSVKAGLSTELCFREVDASDRVVAAHNGRVDGLIFVHDFAFTPHWFVLGGNPLRVKLGEYLRTRLGLSTLLRSIATDAKAQGTLHLIPRGGGPVRTVRLPEPSWVVHFGNAFERDGDLFIDASIFHRFDFGEEFGYTSPRTPFDPTLPEIRGAQRLYRITIPNGSTEARWEQLSEYGIDFPRFHPDHEGRETPALFGATRRDKRFSDPFDSIVRVDLRDRSRPDSIWSVPENVFVGEPIFVPTKGSDTEGHVLAIVSDGLKSQSSLCILDADDLAKGPIATVPLPLLPVAFHGDWDAQGGEG